MATKTQPQPASEKPEKQPASTGGPTSGQGSRLLTQALNAGLLSNEEFQKLSGGPTGETGRSLAARARELGMDLRESTVQPAVNPPTGSTGSQPAQQPQPATSSGPTGEGTSKLLQYAHQLGLIPGGSVSFQPAVDQPETVTATEPSSPAEDSLLKKARELGLVSEDDLHTLGAGPVQPPSSAPAADLQATEDAITALNPSSAPDQPTDDGG